MALDQEQTLRECPHCGSANAVAAGARECPCCGQGYGAQGLADHLPVPDEDARLAPAALAVAGVVALGVAAAFAITPWALIVAFAAVALFVAVLVLAR
jgi:hypothetical protein